MEFVDNNEESDGREDAVGSDCGENVGGCGVALVGCGTRALESDCGGLGSNE